LYDTYGFPLDLTELMAAERGLRVDVGMFTELMEQQRGRSQDAQRTKHAGAEKRVKEIGVGIGEGEFHFDGYDKLEEEVRVHSFVDDILVAYNTPFYAESGGQVGDQGYFQLNEKRVRVLDTQKSGGVHLHILETAIRWEPKEVRVRAVVDSVRRKATERNHSATHLVHEALRRVLGMHLHQQGSLVAPDRLRFDFNHFQKITPEELRAIEDIVNEKISDGADVFALNDPKDWISIEEAKRRYPNVKMFFGDKYGDRVRIVEIDPKFSVELCGGTHVKNSRDIGLFKIISEGSIASGTRRIEAVTGDGLNQYIREQAKKVGEMDESIAKLAEEKAALEKLLGRAIRPVPESRTRITVPVGAVTRNDLQTVDTALKEREERQNLLSREKQELDKEVSKNRIQSAASNLDSLVAGSIAVNGFKLVSARVEARSVEELKSIGDSLRSKLGSGVGLLASVIDDKVSLVCVVTDDLVAAKKAEAGKIVGAIAKLLGGGGGGRPHMATAGGKDVAKLDDAIRQTKSIVESFVK
jgi:alanyl-tRNA synthetase